MSPSIVYSVFLHRRQEHVWQTTHNINVQVECECLCAVCEKCSHHFRLWHILLTILIPPCIHLIIKTLCRRKFNIFLQCLIKSLNSRWFHMLFCGIKLCRTIGIKWNVYDFVLWIWFYAGKMWWRVINLL